VQRGNFRKQPGWTANSWAWHGDDGHIFHRNRGLPLDDGRGFGPGDVVGCGLCLVFVEELNEFVPFLFFTLNGEWIGKFPFLAELLSTGSRFMCGGMTDKEFDWVTGWPQLFPCVGLDAHDTVHFNFGKEAFKFDPDEFFPHGILDPTKFEWATTVFSRQTQNARTFARPALGVMVPFQDHLEWGRTDDIGSDDE
jgi:hypothetical protein